MIFAEYFENHVKDGFAYADGLHVVTIRRNVHNAHAMALQLNDDGTVLVADSHYRKPTKSPSAKELKWPVWRAWYITFDETFAGGMPPRKPVLRRRWTKAEDDAIRQAAEWNAFEGLTDEDKVYQNRLKEVAHEIDRTYAAVRVRASRIRAVSNSIKKQMRIDE